MTRRKLKLNEMREGTYLKHNSMIHLLEHIEKLENGKYIIHAQYALSNRKGAELHVNYIQEEKFAKSLYDLEDKSIMPTKEEIAKLDKAIKRYKEDELPCDDLLLIILKNNETLTNTNKELVDQNKVLFAENKDLRESLEKLMKEFK